MFSHMAFDLVLNNLDTQTWPRYGKYVSVHQKWSSKVIAWTDINTDRQTHRQTHKQTHIQTHRQKWLKALPIHIRCGNNINTLVSLEMRKHCSGMYTTRCWLYNSLYPLESPDRDPLDRDPSDKDSPGQTSHPPPPQEVTLDQLARQEVSS